MPRRRQRTALHSTTERNTYAMYAASGERFGDSVNKKQTRNDAARSAGHCGIARRCTGAPWRCEMAASAALQKKTTRRKERDDAGAPQRQAAHAVPPQQMGESWNMSKDGTAPWARQKVLRDIFEDMPGDHVQELWQARWSNGP